MKLAVDRWGRFEVAEEPTDIPVKEDKKVCEETKDLTTAGRCVKPTKPVTTTKLRALQLRDSYYYTPISKIDSVTMPHHLHDKDSVTVL